MAADFLNELISAIKPKTDKKNRTHSAIVSKVDSDGVAWVYVAGSDRETPIASAASEIKRGDAVNVEWRNNKLYIAGNYSNPSAGVVRVTNVENAAQVANQLAGQASESAAVAQDAADRAVRDADTAHQAANTAQASADRSLVQLSIVEDVAGTLNWISEHGEYVATTDTQVDPDKVYFELVDGDYVPIANPDPEANPAESGWYILDVTDSQSDYIMAHLAVTSAGLWVLPSGQWAMHPLTDSDGDYLINSDGDYVSDWSKDPQNASGYKVLLSATGMTVFDGEGVAVASYGAEMVLGRLDSGNLIARPTGIAIRDGLEELATFSVDGECFYVYNVSTGVIEKCFEVSTSSIVRTINGRVLAVLQADDTSHTETLRYFPDTGSTIVVRGSAFSGAHTYTQGVETSEEITCQDGSVASVITLSYDGEKTFTIVRKDSASLQVSFSIAFTYKKIDPYFTLGDRIESDGIGANSCIIGEALSAPYDNQLVIGYANTAEDKAFIIGDGVDETNTKNIFTVDRTGDVDAYGTYKVNGSDFITSESYDLGVISITSGTPGTASGVITKTIEKTGYRPICVKIRYVQASIIGFNAFFTGTVASGDIESVLVVQVIRRQSGAASPGYHAYADVTYIKS